MNSAALISPEEYLHSSFEGPDREYIHGTVIERNRGENQHSRTQWLLSGIFYDLSKRKPIFGRTEIRLRLAFDRYRIPDLAVFAGAEPQESIPSIPPLITVEIISPDDRYTEVVQKLEEYRRWGVPNVWLVDPGNRRLYVCGEAGLQEVESLSVAELEIQITGKQIF